MKEDKITVMIVDDDIKSQQVLEYHLRSIPGIEILSIASSADEAYRFLLETVPDLIFLDVEMPGKTGFDLLYEIRKLGIKPCIIFQTAFDKYAIEAIKHAAFDYLLKPIDKEELLKALARVRNSRHQHTLEEKVESLISRIKSAEKIRFNTRAGFILIDPGEIIYCKADWSYTEIWFLKEKKEVVTMNIGKLESILPSEKFIRISRSIIINKDHVNRLNCKTRIITLSKTNDKYEFKISQENLKSLKGLFLSYQD